MHDQRLLHCWPYVWRIHWSPMDSPHKRFVVPNFDFFFHVIADPVCSDAIGHQRFRLALDQKCWAVWSYACLNDLLNTRRVAGTMKTHNTHVISLLWLVCHSVALMIEGLHIKCTLTVKLWIMLTNPWLWNSMIDAVHIAGPECSGTWKCITFAWDFTEFFSKGSNEQYSSIGSDNGLSPTRRQAIMWSNDG